MNEGQEQKMNLATLEGQVALVTGGAGGLGEATCAVLSEDGATVVVADIREDKAREVANKLGSKAQAMGLDVCDEVQIQKAIKDIVAKYGHLDVLINNAAIDKTVSVEEMTADEWHRIIGINLSGPFLLSKYA